MAGYWKKVSAEFIGTFALLFAGCGSIMVNALHDGVIGHLGICAVFGLVVMSMIYAVGHVSGAHFNPAVTVAFAAMGRFSWREVPGYILGQCVAALLACLVLWAVLEPSAAYGATVPSIETGPAIVLEFLLTFFLMFVIASVATDSRAAGVQAGWAIGGTVMFCALVGGPLTGAAMNPARSLGPAVFSGELSTLWIYCVGPFLGATMGGIVYQWLRCGGDPLDASGCC